MSSGPHGLHVLDHGGHAEGARPTVVLVHGSLDRATSFARVVRRLPDLRVVTYDRRGYNGSRHVRPPATTLHDHVADLVELVEAVGGSGGTVVVGHSYGGDVALGAALARPGSIGAVAAYEPPLPWLDWWPRRTGAAHENPGAFAESFYRRLVGDGAWERLPDQARRDRRADGEALLAELSDLRSHRAPWDISALEVPAVLGRGGSSVGHHRRAIDELHDAIRDSQVVEIEGAGHGAHLSHPGAFAEMVRAALARVG